MFVGIVATLEHVPNETIAGFRMCANIARTPSLPAPIHAIIGNAVKIYTKHTG
jgi:hypothetical protein